MSARLSRLRSRLRRSPDLPPGRRQTLRHRSVAGTSLVGVCVVTMSAFMSACGGDAAQSRSSTPLPAAPQLLVAAMAPLPDGGFLWGNRVTGVIHRIDANGHRQGVVARVRVSADHLHGLLGLAYKADGRVFAAWTDATGHLTVGQVLPAPTRIIWRGPATSRFDIGGHLVATPNGALLLGIGAGVLLTPNPSTSRPTGALLLLRPSQHPGQPARVLSTGWNNPFAFTYTPQGHLWVADNVPGTRGERLARGDLQHRPTHISPLPPDTAPSGLAAISTHELALCGFRSHRLQRYDITATQRAVVIGSPIARNSWLGVIRLATGRLAYAGLDTTITLINTSGANRRTLHR